MDNQPNEEFSSVIDLLKERNALPNEAFTENIPFFNMNTISKEAQIREIFQRRQDFADYETALQTILARLNTIQLNKPLQSQSRTQSMSFAQIVLYKVLPCSDSECQKCPRGVVTHNQYKDTEYECPFYHHDKDRRRLVIGAQLYEEFEYKANYFDERRPTGNREEYSQNYFESMFHPLYYKMFRCKRNQCDAHEFCPSFHNEEERQTWDRLFSSFMGKERVLYVKDKQKYYESSSGTLRTEHQKSSSPEDLNKENYNYNRQDVVLKSFKQKRVQTDERSMKKGRQYPLKRWNEEKMQMFALWEKNKN